jgi:phytoene/squalene synthetase
MSKSQSYCLELVKKHDYSHYLTLLFANQRQRRILSSIRALNIETSLVQDHVQKPELGAIRLQWWKGLALSQGI